MSNHIHVFPIRVYYEDTDIAGIVYYANYLKFAERARTEALRESGIDQLALMEEHGISFVVKQCLMDFVRPARFDDLLTVETNLYDIKRASIIMQQNIKLNKKILVRLEIKLAVVGENMKLTRMPEFVQKAIIKTFDQ